MTPDAEDGTETDWMELTDLAGVAVSPPLSLAVPKSDAARSFSDSLLGWSDGEWFVTVAMFVFEEEYFEENEEMIEMVALELAGLLASDLEESGMAESEFLALTRS